MEPIRRNTARVIPVSPQGRALLLRGHDPRVPDFSYWFTIGGGIEPSETARQAAVRECWEEVSILIEEDDLVGPFHAGQHSYSYDGAAYDSNSVFFALNLDERAVQPAGLSGEVITDARWWDPNSLRSAPLSNPNIPDIVDLAIAEITSTQR